MNLNGAFGSVFKMILALSIFLISLFNTFLTTAELSQLDNIPAGQELLYEGLFEELELVRIEIFSADVMRSLIYLILGAGAVFVAIKNKDFAKMAVVPVLALFIILDLLSVDLRYLGNETKAQKGQREAEWKQTWKQEFPVVAAAGDKQILELELADPIIKKDVEEKVAVLRKELKAEKIKGGELSRQLERKQYRTFITDFRSRTFRNSS